MKTAVQPSGLADSPFDLSASDLLIDAKLPGKPVPKARARMGGNGRWYTPRGTREAEDDWRWAMRAARVHSVPTRHAVALQVLFTLRGNRRPDLDNLLKGLADSGNGILWDDDRQIIAIRCGREDLAAADATYLRAWQIPVVAHLARYT